MTNQHLAYINLEECVSSYISESEQSIHRKVKINDIAISAMDELGLDMFYEVVTVKLPVNANVTVTLPGNCLNVIKSGILNSSGEIVTLNKNKKLTTYADLLPDRISKVEDNTLFDWNYSIDGTFYNFWNNGTLCNLYGLPSGAPFIGSFVVDMPNGVIVLDPNYQFDYLMVEILTSPSQDETYMVPLHFKRAIIDFIWWKDNKVKSVIRNKVGIDRDLRHEYFNSRRLAFARWKPFSLAEAYQQNVENQRMTTKT